MHFLFACLVFAVLSVAALGEQGTMSTDDSQVSGSEASMSGYKEDELDLREEEVQLQEDDYDPTVDDRPVEIQIDQDKMDRYNEEVEEATP